MREHHIFSGLFSRKERGSSFSKRVAQQEVLTGVSFRRRGQMPFLRTAQNTERALPPIGEVVTDAERRGEAQWGRVQQLEQRRALFEEVETKTKILEAEAILTEVARDLHQTRHAQDVIPTNEEMIYTEASTTMTTDGTPEYPFMIRYSVQGNGKTQEIKPIAYAQKLYKDSDGEEGWDSALSPRYSRGPHVLFSFSDGAIDVASLRWDGDIFGENEISLTESEMLQGKGVTDFLTSHITVPEGRYLNNYALQLSLGNESKKPSVIVDYTTYLPKKEEKLDEDAEFEERFHAGLERDKKHALSRKQHHIEYGFRDNEDAGIFRGQRGELEQTKYIALFQDVISFLPIIDLNQSGK